MRGNVSKTNCVVRSACVCWSGWGRIGRGNTGSDIRMPTPRSRYSPSFQACRAPLSRRRRCVGCGSSLALHRNCKGKATRCLKPGLYFERKSTPYTQTILRTWSAYSRPPMPIYAVVIAQMASINTPTKRRRLRWPLPAFWSSADLETWMLDCHWLIAHDICVFYAAYKINPSPWYFICRAGFYAAYKINPSPWNGTQTAIAYVCVNTHGDLCSPWV